MDFPQYQQGARETAVYPGQGQGAGLAYVALGLAGEAGEVANKVKKILRDKGGVLNVNEAAKIAEEAGDVLWYLAALCDELGADLGQIAALNLAKLESRAMRGKIQGNGDNR
ncbi:nucleotide pyrophosphohydrolase [Streptomyces phage Araceli]|nr:nucleotide pyrophosphohydrolase [Streptomyces phage JackieB]QFG07873.1 nucleotide pyrophosphohydrolase [Streptomyces phage Araceli]